MRLAAIHRPRRAKRRWFCAWAALAIVAAFCCGCPRGIGLTAPSGHDPAAINLLKEVAETYKNMDSLKVNVEDEIFDILQWHESSAGGLVIDKRKRAISLQTNFVYKRPDRASVVHKKRNKTYRGFFDGKDVFVSKPSVAEGRYVKQTASATPEEAIRKLLNATNTVEVVSFLYPLLNGDEEVFSLPYAHEVFFNRRHPEAAKYHVIAITLASTSSGMTDQYFIGKSDNLIYKIQRVSLDSSRQHSGENMESVGTYQYVLTNKPIDDARFSLPDADRLSSD